MSSNFRRRLAAPHIALLLATITPLTPAAAQTVRSDAFVVVVNAGNPIDAIDRETLSGVFLKRVAKWPSGAGVEPIDLSLRAPAREAFSRLILRKSISAVRTYWHQQIFSGREVPPPEKTSDAEVLDIVKAAPDAVGYVSASAAIPAGVKVLLVREKP
jgi:ABC-type phosphate transport system substrate-binding protein